MTPSHSSRLAQTRLLPIAKLGPRTREENMKSTIFFCLIIWFADAELKARKGKTTGARKGFHSPIMDMYEVVSKIKQTYK